MVAASEQASQQASEQANGAVISHDGSSTPSSEFTAVSSCP
ncbi:MAG: hypothetical protein AAFV46_03295 [Cyanobacteria bacterium J06635_11]